MQSSRFTVQAPTIYLLDTVFQLEIPKNGRLIAEIKQRVAVRDRVWNRQLGTQGRWVIDIIHVEFIRVLLRQFYENISEVAL